MNPSRTCLYLSAFLLLFGTGTIHASAASCRDAFDEKVHAKLWGMTAGEWASWCDKKGTSKKAFIAAKKAFIEKCLEYARPAVSAGMLTEKKAREEHCEKGIPGRNTIPMPSPLDPNRGFQGSGTSFLSPLRTDRFNSLNTEIDSLLEGGDIANLYGEQSLQRQNLTASGGVLGPTPGAGKKFADFTAAPVKKKLQVPEKLPEAGPKIDAQMAGMSGAVADWMNKNQDRLLARKPGEGYWESETRKAKIINSYFNLRVEECKTRTGWKSYIICGYYKTRKVTSGAAVALGENTASTLADFTPIVGEIKYGKEVLTGEQEFTALGAIGSISIFKPLKVFRLAKAGNLMGKMEKMLELVKLSRPIKIVKNAKFFPSQNIASRTHVAGYATIMKAGLWDWSRAGKITYSMDKGKRVIVNGHHRYMAAKLADVKIPKEAFRLIKEPSKMRIAFDWDKMSWGNSLHATRDFKEILAKL